MSTTTGPLEGKIVLLRYTEVDYHAEGNVMLVYEVKDGKLEVLYGILDLPYEVSGWEIIDIDFTLTFLKERNVTEVYTPLYGQSFLGRKIGYFDISEGVNEKGEVECWGESEGLYRGPDTDFLESNGITVHWVDPKTLQIYE